MNDIFSVDHTAILDGLDYNLAELIELKVVREKLYKKYSDSFAAYLTADAIEEDMQKSSLK